VGARQILAKRDLLVSLRWASLHAGQRGLVKDVVANRSLGDGTVHGRAGALNLSVKLVTDV
jgi:hypothetical protein